MTKSSHTGQDLVGRLRPNERRGRGVAKVDVGEDPGFERARAAMRATPDLFVSQQGEPALHEIEPGRTGNGIEELAKPLGPMPSMQLADDLSALGIQRRESDVVPWRTQS